MSTLLVLFVGLGALCAAVVGGFFLLIGQEFSLLPFFGATLFVWYFPAFWLIQTLLRAEQDKGIEEGRFDPDSLGFWQSPRDGPRSLRTAIVLTLIGAGAVGVAAGLGAFTASASAPETAWMLLFFGGINVLIALIVLLNAFKESLPSVQKNRWLALPVGFVMVALGGFAGVATWILAQQVLDGSVGQSGGRSPWRGVAFITAISVTLVVTGTNLMLGKVKEKGR